MKSPRATTFTALHELWETALRLRETAEHKDLAVEAAILVTELWPRVLFIEQKRATSARAVNTRVQQLERTLARQREIIRNLADRQEWELYALAVAIEQRYQEALEMWRRLEPLGPDDPS